MKKNKAIKVLALLLIVAVLFGCMGISAFAAEKEYDAVAMQFTPKAAGGGATFVENAGVYTFDQSTGGADQNKLYTQTAYALDKFSFKINATGGTVHINLGITESGDSSHWSVASGIILVCYGSSTSIRTNGNEDVALAAKDTVLYKTMLDGADHNVMVEIDRTNKKIILTIDGTSKTRTVKNALLETGNFGFVATGCAGTLSNISGQKEKSVVVPPIPEKEYEAVAMQFTPKAAGGGATFVENAGVYTFDQSKGDADQNKLYTQTAYALDKFSFKINATGGTVHINLGITESGDSSHWSVASGIILVCYGGSTSIRTNGNEDIALAAEDTVLYKTMLDGADHNVMVEIDRTNKKIILTIDGESKTRTVKNALLETGNFGFVATGCAGTLSNISGLKEKSVVVPPIPEKEYEAVAMQFTPKAAGGGATFVENAGVYTFDQSTGGDDQNKLYTQTAYALDKFSFKINATGGTVHINLGITESGDSSHWSVASGIILVCYGSSTSIRTNGNEDIALAAEDTVLYKTMLDGADHNVMVEIDRTNKKIILTIDGKSKTRTVKNALLETGNFGFVATGCAGTLSNISGQKEKGTVVPPEPPVRDTDIVEPVVDKTNVTYKAKNGTTANVTVGETVSMGATTSNVDLCYYSSSKLRYCDDYYRFSFKVEATQLSSANSTIVLMMRASDPVLPHWGLKNGIALILSPNVTEFFILNNCSTTDARTNGDMVSSRYLMMDGKNHTVEVMILDDENKIIVAFDGQKSTQLVYTTTDANYIPKLGGFGVSERMAGVEISEIVSKNSTGKVIPLPPQDTGILVPNVADTVTTWKGNSSVTVNENGSLSFLKSSTPLIPGCYFTYDNKLADDYISFKMKVNNPNEITAESTLGIALRAEDGLLPHWSASNGIYILLTNYAAQAWVLNEASTETVTGTDHYMVTYPLFLFDGEEHTIQIQIDDEAGLLIVAFDYQLNQRILLNLPTSDQAPVFARYGAFALSSVMADVLVSEFSFKNSTGEIYGADHTAPEIRYTGSKALNFKAGDVPNITATASDNVDKKVVVTFTYSAGALLDGKLQLGNHTLTLTASDVAGNEAKPVVITLTVTAPEVEKPSEGCNSTSAAGLLTLIMTGIAVALLGKRL